MRKETVMTSIDNAIEQLQHEINVLGRATAQKLERLKQLQTEREELFHVELEIHKSYEDWTEPFGVAIAKIIGAPEPSSEPLRCRKCHRLICSHQYRGLCIGCCAEEMAED